MSRPTYTPLATVTLGSSASSVTFSNIPATYRDLVLVSNSRLSSGAGQLFYRFNSDVGSNYSFVWMSGNGSSTNSASITTSLIFTSNNINDSTDNWSTYTLNLLDYSATDKHKTALLKSDNSAISAIRNASRWANTSAINNITVNTSGGTFVSGSNFSLYGVIA